MNISSFAYLTSSLNSDQYDWKSVTGSDKAKANTKCLNTEGITPNMFDTLIEDYISIDFKTDSGLSLGEQLYSKRGSQSGATGAFQVKDSNYDPSDYKQYMLMTVTPRNEGNSNRFYKKRAIWTASSIPAFSMSDRSTRGCVSFLVSIPHFTLLTGPFRSVNQTRYGVVFIKFTAEGGTDEYQEQQQAFVKDAKETMNWEESNAISFNN